MVYTAPHQVEPEESHAQYEKKMEKKQEATDAPAEVDESKFPPERNVVREAGLASDGSRVSRRRKLAEKKEKGKS